MAHNPDELVEFIKRTAPVEETVQSLFRSEIQRASVGRLRLCILVLFAILTAPVFSHWLITGVDPVSYRPLIGVHVFLLFLYAMTFWPRVERSTLWAVAAISVVLGFYDLWMQLIHHRVMEAMATSSLFFLTVGFLMPWGGGSTLLGCGPLALFFVAGCIVQREELSTPFVVQANLYQFVFLMLVCAASAMNEAFRFEEFSLRKEMERENALLQDYQTRLKRANLRLEQMSVVDPLTGLFNRGYLRQWLENEVFKEKKPVSLLSLIMFDIDHFKKINDVAGHQQGDKVLRLMAQTVREDLVEPGKIFRYGGDEFCIIMPGVTLDEAVPVAERLRSSIEQNPRFSFRFPDGVCQLTLSMGVTMEYVGPTMDTDYLIRWVDAALLESKRKGKNLVHVFDPDDRCILDASEWIRKRKEKG